MSTQVPDEISMEDLLCDSSFGSMVTLDYVNPLTGYEPKDMELTDTNERNLATSSDIYFQNALDDTASFPNVPDVDDDELAEFLAVVVDRTGHAGGIWKGDVLIADLEELETMDASEIYSKRLNAKEVIFPKKEILFSQPQTDEPNFLEEIRN